MLYLDWPLSNTLNTNLIENTHYSSSNGSKSSLGEVDSCSFPELAILDLIMSRKISRENPIFSRQVAPF